LSKEALPLRIITLSSAALAAAVALWSLAAQAANPRIALVIGEQTYADATLPTTANDAGLVAEVLQTAGFDVVGARDLDQKSLREALRDFLDKANAAGPDMQAFVYVSGRALQYAGDNYLAPVDAHIARASDVPIEAVKLSDFTHALAAAPGLARVVVVDGARPNPYAQQGEPLAGGLALVDPEPNSVIAFNAAPGAIGVPDAEGYSVYAKTLAGLMRQGGVDIRDVLSQTRLEVNQQTGGAEVPWSAGKLDAPYFLFERAADAKPVALKRPPVKTPLKQLSPEEAYLVAIDRDDLGVYEQYVRDFPNAPEARRIEAILAARREALFWRRSSRENTPRAYWTYLRRYPHGPHAWDADRRLDALAARREPPGDFRVIDYDDLPPPPPDEIQYADRPVYFFGGDDFGPPPPPPPRDYFVEDDDWRALPPPQRPTIAGVLPALAVAIPLGLAARAYMSRPHADGRAPASAPPPAPRPMGPPPLPRSVQAAPTPGATPATGRPKPSPAPGATPSPLPSATPSAGALRPLPTPSPTPAAGATPGAVGARPSPLPSAAATPGAPRPSPTALPTPQAVKPTSAPTPLPTRTPEVRPTPKAMEAPKPPRATELPKSAPPPAPRPAVEAPRPAPAAPPRVEAPRPAPPAPAAPPRVEAPRPAPPPPPAPRAEAPKPPAAAACGHPGQPHC
jgi:uncharacterized caspase-like protein